VGIIRRLNWQRTLLILLNLTPAARAKLERSGNFVAVPAIVIARMPRQ